MNKLRMWNGHESWEAAEEQWDRGSHQAHQQAPLKTLKRLPKIPGITKKTARYLKWKSLHWMITEDNEGKIVNQFFKRPLHYTFEFLKSLKKKSYKRDGDLFFYGIKSIRHFKALLKQSKTLFVIGFSYCHKPFECPSGRFTDQCIHDPENPICRQCFIGKCSNALPKERTVVLYIPTVHYISGKILDLMKQYPTLQVLFLITACELTLEMFGDFGNMAKIKGIGVRLDGRICNTMEAFKLSEKGIKPGLTVVLDPTQQRILDLIRYRREHL